jgi:hypothetical protein
MRHIKYRPGSIVLLRKLDDQGKVATIWGGEVLTNQPRALTVLAIEMVYQGNAWHAVGDFREIAAPPHRVLYEWDFPRLLVKYEANPTDLEARPVIETALEHYRKAHAAGPSAGGKAP